MTDCNPTILKAELQSLSVINERLNCEIGNLKTELESLRQENSRLREENHRLKVHLCIGTDALKEPTDMYEVVRKNELHRLREALERKESALKGAVFNNAEMDAEVKRLREALKEIRDRAYIKSEFNRIALAALNPPKS